MALAVGHPTLVSYASGNAPAFRMLADMRAQTATSSGAPVLAVHRRQDFDLRRPMKWVGPEAPAFSERLGAPPRLEWLELVEVLEQRRAGNGVVRQRPAAERSRARPPWRAARDVPMAAPLPRAHRWRSAGRNGLVCDRSACLVSRRGLVADARKLPVLQSPPAKDRLPVGARDGSAGRQGRSLS